LDQIPGIGEKTIIKLLQTFKSVKRVSAASEAELESVVGVSKAKQIFIYLHPNS
jgi:excinuclease ABC subunit C